MSATARTRVRIDPIACDGYGYCAELVPELIALDEWGYPMLADAPVTPDIADVVAQAVAQCPRRAIFVERRVPTPRRRDTAGAAALSPR